MRILWIELRRSVALQLGTAILLLALGTLYLLPGPWWKGTAPWNEQWTGLAQWSRYMLIFLWPLVLGGGAWQGTRDRRSRMSELLASTPRRTIQRALPSFGAMAIGLTLALVVVLMVGGVQVATHTTYIHVKWIPVAVVGVVALLGIGWLGIAVGHAAPTLITAPVVAVGGMVLQIALIQTGWPALLSPAFEATDINVFSTVPFSLTLTQSLWFLTIGATGLWFFVASSWCSRLTALSPLVIGAIVASLVLPDVSRTVADTAAQSLVCDENTPRVCVTRVHAAQLAVVAAPARAALARLAKLPSPPNSVEELVPSELGAARTSTSPNVVHVSLTGDSYRHDATLLTNPDEVRLNILAGAGTPVCAGRNGKWDQVVRVAVARTVAAGWLDGDLRPLPGYEDIWDIAADKIHSAWDSLLSLPPAEQRDKVAAFRSAALNCDEKMLNIFDGIAANR